MNSARSWLVWGVAILAYVVAVLQRTSLGVSGVEAADRFGVSASALSSLAVLQLVVYAVVSWDSFRIALLVQYLVIGTGVIFVLRARRLTRRKLHEDEGIRVAPLWVALAREWRRRTNGA